eukprot:8770822-Ditylum_brightwellii.AAC.1
MDDVQWDFQAAENYMKNSSLQYEDDCGKRRHCIKNVIMKRRHQFLGYFSTFLLSNTGFKFSVAKLGAKSKMNYITLKKEFLSYKGKGEADDRGPEDAYDLFCQNHVYKEKSSSASAHEDKDDEFEMDEDDDQADSDIQNTTTPAKQK